MKLKLQKLSDRYFRLIIYGCIIAFVIFIQCFGLRVIGAIDIIWQYNSAASIVDGLLPYRDYNMITTPFYYFISAFFLSFHKSLAMKMITDDILIIITDILLFELSRLITKSRIRQIFSVVFSCFVIGLGFAYNTMLLTIGLSIILIQKDSQDIGRNKAILTGILAACAILTKQTVGTLIAVAELIYICKTQPKTCRVAYIFSGMSVGILFLIYLIITGSLNSFLDYCVTGAGSFIGNAAFDVIFPVFLFFIFIGFHICSKQYEHNKNLFVIQILVLNTVMLMLAFPLFDYPHLENSISISLVSICVWGFQGNIKSKLRKCRDFVSKAIMACLIVFLFTYHTGTGIFVSLVSGPRWKPFYLSLLDSSCVVRGIEENKKIEEKYDRHVTVISSLYAGPMSYLQDTHEGVYDLFLTGNFGSATAEQLVDKAGDKGDIIAIYDEDYERYYQFPVEIREYIKENYNLLYHSDYAKINYYVKE